MTVFVCKNVLNIHASLYFFLKIYSVTGICIHLQKFIDFFLFWDRLVFERGQKTVILYDL